MREIPLTQGKVAVIDDDDFVFLSTHRWHADRRRNTFYAQREVVLSDGRRTEEYMHRVVLSRKLGRALLPGECSDHVNGNGLDNCRRNLRSATKAQNGMNCRRHSNNRSSRYVGISWDKNREKWQAYVQASGKKISLGRHTSELVAVQARESYIGAHPELMARSNLCSDLGGQS